jgi:hypothetical protein
MRFLFVLPLLMLAGCEESERDKKIREAEALWRSASVLKVCIDGTRVYKINGRIALERSWTIWLQYVEGGVSANEVCATSSK